MTFQVLTHEIQIVGSCFPVKFSYKAYIDIELGAQYLALYCERIAPSSDEHLNGIEITRRHTIHAVSAIFLSYDLA